MKRIICLTIALCLVLGSFSFAFAAVSDQQAATITTNTTNIADRLRYNNISAARYLYDIYQQLVTMPTASGQSTTNTRLQTVNNNLADIKQYLNLLNSSVSGIAGSLSSGGSGIATILSNIFDELVYTNAGGTVIHAIQTLVSYISNIRSYTNTINQNVTAIGSEILSSFPATVQKLTSIDSTLSSTYTLENNTLPGIYAYSGSIDTTLSTYQPYLQSLYNLDLLNGMEAFGGGSTVTVRGLTSAGGENINTYNFSSDNWRSNLGRFAQYINNNVVRGFSFITSGFNTTQTRTNWKTLASETYTPTSTTDGIYYWLGSIQTPIARLASVYASDEEISAREKAANNQSKAVNNFVDPNGSGSLPGASIDNLGNLSSQWKTNLNVGVSTSRIFDIFDSSHGTWFSQETADQLDTTSSNRSKSSYPTPLLDQKLEELNNAIGEQK